MSAAGPLPRSTASMSSRRSPPPASAHARPLPAQRLLGLSPTAATRVREAALRFGQGDLAAAELALLAAMVTSPEGPTDAAWGKSCDPADP